MPSTQRLASIDVFRALTMLLMIFVNDLWTLVNVPSWLEHTAAEADGMGLADVVFPAFLFIVGLSIPFSIGRRLEKGEPSLKHILTRSLALLVMGFFHVNMESYEGFLPKPIWVIAVTVAFFLIWLDYKEKRIWLQLTGVALLIMLALLFKGWMKPHWWGILGLIGWSYLISALVFLFAKGRLWVLIMAMLILNIINIATGDGSSPALTMAGAVVGVMFKKRRNLTVLILFGIVMLAAGFAIRPWEGISKIRATPAWVLICTGISILFFTGLIVLVDIKKKQHWFTIIKPAGTSTLTAYLLPYIHYALYSMIGISLPLFLRTGIPGIIKSLIYALVIILITGWLEKKQLRLRI